MNKKEIENKVKKIISDLLSIEEKSIHNNSNFINDLRVESLDSIEILMMIEDEFEISIEEEEVEKIVNFDLLINLISRKFKK